ncbi:hypothetical protein [Clostridium sp.]|uniref:hypothetical protein n=1 Tax=Clostridium sp. TaxID=1506 RepID=UPI0025BF7FED|nr:hypothetical protein [Clostridium sp.]
MKSFKNEDILKSTPDYEDYTKNEAKLSVQEMRDLGLLKCGGCCSSKGSSSGCGCKSKRK